MPTRLLTLAAFAAVLLVAPGTAAATGVTTSSYDSTSTDSDIRKS